MAGYARVPYSRGTDVGNRLLLSFGPPPPSVVTPGEVPDVPRMHGREFVSGASEPDDDWAARMDAKRPPQGNTDQDMIAYPPNYPGYRIPEALEENLPQMPGYAVDGTLPVNATQAPMNPNDPRYAQWLRLMRQRGSI